MLRTVLAVVAGYAAMFIGVMVLFTAYFFLIGVEATYEPGSYEVTALWIIGSIILSFVAAYVGGWVCTVLARERLAAKVLAGIVLVLGVVMAFMWTSEGAGAVRMGDVSISDAMSMSVEPRWLTLLNPFLGALGVLLGAARVRVAAPAPSATLAARTATEEE
jgi:hypothetical protein